MKALLTARRLAPDYRFSAWVLFVAIIAGLIVLAGFDTNRGAVGPERHTEMTTELDHRMSNCIHDTMDIIGTNNPPLWVHKDVWNQCYHQIYTIDSLIDFDIRRDKLLRQELDERVLLWMVVSVTISGVLLAALQLLASYRLATLGQIDLAQPSQLSIEKGSLALKSSVTGLFILAFSLAFFVVYVKWIYQTQEISSKMPDVTPIETRPPGLHGTEPSRGDPDPSPPGSRPLQPPAPSPSLPDQKMSGNRPAKSSGRTGPDRLPAQ